MDDASTGIPDWRLIGFLRAHIPSLWQEWIDADGGRKCSAHTPELGADYREGSKSKVFPCNPVACISWNYWYAFPDTTKRERDMMDAAGKFTCQYAAGVKFFLHKKKADEETVKNEFFSWQLKCQKIPEMEEKSSR